MDTHLFLEMLGIDSTSGKEGELADMMAGRLSGPGRRVETFEVGDGTRNVLVSWGEPEVFFCTHLDGASIYPAVQRHCAFCKADLLFSRRQALRGKGN